MKDLIFALLTESFTGVRKDGLKQLARILALQASTQEEAEALVEKLTKEQVNHFIREFRIDVDKEVHDSKKKYETNLKKNIELVEKKNDLNPAQNDDDCQEKEEDTSRITAMVKATLEAELTPLKQELASFKTNETVKTRLQSLNDKLTGCKDETFKTKALKDFIRMKFDTDDEFHEYLSDTEKDILTANQQVADAALGSQGKPLFTQKNERGVSQGVAQYVASQQSGAKAFPGKEV
jgi:hypothetical protein